MVHHFVLSAEMLVPHHQKHYNLVQPEQLFRKNHNQKNQAVCDALPLDDFADRHFTDDNTIERIAISGAMDRFLDGLPEKQRLVFVARFYKHEPIDEIARVFSMPSGSVKSIIHRAKKALKDFLDKEGINV